MLRLPCMSEQARANRWFSYRTWVVLALLAGIVASLVSFRLGRDEEVRQAEAEFEHRAVLRHTLTREILGHYEDALFALSAVFTASDAVTLAEFHAITARIGARITGVQAFEWVPVVPGRARPNWEEELARAYDRPVEFVEVLPDRTRRRAAQREEYWPIAYVQPLQGNEAALGFDLATGPTRDLLQRARETRQMVVTRQVRLVQESDDHFGVIMAWPVYRHRAGSEERFLGFLQCVFRVRDLLETAHTRQPDTMLDMLFVDASERDAARRTLYHRPADDQAPRDPVPEETFRTGLHREFKLPLGGRDWRVIFRPRVGWLESRRTAVPVLRSGSMLLLAILVSGIIHVIGRRNETIRREVDERTAELAESRRQVANMLHALPGMAYRCTYEEQLNVQFLSEGARELTGWTAEEFMSGKAHFREIIHPDDLARVRDVTRAALQERNDVEVEYRIRTRSGAEKWVLSRGRGVYQVSGDLRFFEGLAIDITAQKNAETARLALERKLLEGQKLESLGLLAGGIAHDFNNLLSSILGNASIVRLNLPPDAGVEQHLRAIEAASLRAAELCRQMLAYAGKGRFVVEPVDVSALVEDLLPLLKISVVHHGRLRLDLARNLPAVLADATQLRQIVMNLVLNASDALSDRDGEIVISSGVMHADHALLSTSVAGSGLTTGDYVFLEVRDTGVGMTPEVQAKMFDPFFTTKFAGRGLGLAAVLGIVRGHNGALCVQSAPGSGSSFRLLLPQTTAALPPRPADVAQNERWRRSGSVLVIEDEEAVRVVTGEILKSFGLTPTAAASGEEGVQLFQRSAGAFDLVLLDLLMPGMSGEQVLAHLRATAPQVRVLLMSGYAEGDILGRLGGGPGKLAFIAKPFTRAALEAKLRAMLE